MYISCQTEKQVHVAYTNEVLQQDNINNIVIEYQSKKLVTQTTFQNKEKDEVLLSFGYGIRIWACIGRKIEITSV